MNLDYLVTHGQSNHLGRFVALEPLALRRGERVVIETARGLEIGNVLCAATPNHVRLLDIPPGKLVRSITSEDEQTETSLQDLAKHVFDSSRNLVAELKLELEILDVEVLLDGRHAVIQFLGGERDVESLASALEDRHDLAVQMENLSVSSADSEAPAEAGCGKPDCGQARGGGCTTCSTGGCGTGCGTGGSKLDMREYFAHLRGQMEASQRVPLV